MKHLGWLARGIPIMTEEEKGFVIKDRRRFTAEGEPVASPEAEERTKAESSERLEASPRRERPAAREDVEEALLPEVTFATFIFSLGSSALLHLGEMPDPQTNQRTVRLPLAKQTIDILGMLEEKTRGNLDEDEQNLLRTLLYELRMKYVSATR
jgi:hypothetical protein